MRIGHPRSRPTRTWRREGRSHSQLWPHITACEMPTFRATTPHGQHGGTTSAAETQWARQRAKPKRGRAVRRAEHQTAKGGVGAPTPKATHIPEGRHRVDDSGANKSSALGMHPHQDAQLRSTRRNPSSQALEQLRFYGGQRNIIHQSKRSRLRPRSTPALGRLSSASTPLPLFKIAPTTIPTLPPRPPWAAIDTTGFDAGPRGDGRAADGHEPRRG